MAQELNKNKVVVGILAVIATIGAIIAWVMKLKYKKPIGTGILVLLTGVAIALWVWYSKLPSFIDSNKSMSEIEQSFDTVTKGDLK